MQAAYNLMCDTISAAFSDQAQARDASLMDLELTFQRILDGKSEQDNLTMSDCRDGQSLRIVLRDSLILAMVKAS